VDLASLARQLLNLRHPLLQLIIRIEILETLLDADVALVPGFLPSAMETYDRQIGCCGRDGRNAGRSALRLVH
jgi:hypothetical protein